MPVQQLKNATVNYTYWLEGNLTPLQIKLFKYSYLKCLSYGWNIYIHANKAFRELCEREEIIPHAFFPLTNNPEIDSKVFWAYHKIKVYNSRPVGEWHLDIDAVFKEEPIIKEVDLQVAYEDIPELTMKQLFIPNGYTLPEWADISVVGLNMSAVMFHNNDLKDKYCQHAFSFMRDNYPLENYGWEHMVWVEQACLKRLCEYYNYTYNYLSDDTDYYHLGAAKKYLTEEEINKQINKIEERIWQLTIPQV
jgi:hypothetical protein